MEQVAARLDLAGPAQVRRLDPQALERVAPGHDHVIGEDRAELERKRVERSAELLRAEQERRREAGVVPRRDAVGAGRRSSAVSASTTASVGVGA